MAAVVAKSEEQLLKITECPICMSSFTDPRMLPCIHTFCFECLNRTGETAQKNPGDKMPCPLCRKDFIIPENGIIGVQKNFFMENFLEYKSALQMSKGHQMVNIGSEVKSESKRFVSMKSCTIHINNPLNYYCADCKKIVCVSCFVESHKLHDCKDVSTIDEKFRQRIQTRTLKVSTNMNEMMVKRNNIVKRKADFLKQIVEEEMKIHERSQELKVMIDRHTKSLLDELSVIKSKHLKEIETGLEDIDRNFTILGSFEAYCTELISKASAIDICNSADDLIARADDLEREQKSFFGRPITSVEVSFQVADFRNASQNPNSNILGFIQETTTEFENCAVVVGFGDGKDTTKDVVKINLHRSNEISKLEKMQTSMDIDLFAAIYCNTLYLVGVGFFRDQIWKYNQASGWKKCGTTNVGFRSRYSAAFIGEVLYICGGILRYNEEVLDSVEAFNTVSNKCTIVGKLIHCVESSGNCVPFKDSLYIFGGSDKDGNTVNHVQVYNTKENTCSVLSIGMPRPYMFMRSVLWETSVILIGCSTCFIFNIETETWQERNLFKTDANYFGLVLEDERLFVIGGGRQETDKGGKTRWKCRDEVRYVPIQNILQNKPIEWTIHGRLPKPCLVDTYASMRFIIV